jgi:hypothetical protein
LVGCAQPPTQQLESAQKGVEAAQTAGASDYAKAEFAKLEEEFSQAKEAIAEQEKQMVIFRSYGKADSLLKQVAEHAKQVETTATINKEAAKTAAVAGEKEAQQVVASAHELMAQAPVGKERVAVESIRQDLTGLRDGLGTVHQLIEKGDYLGAEAQAQALKEKGTAVSTEIQEAIDKMKKLKARRAHVS